jgi:hypothetical protein
MTGICLRNVCLGVGSLILTSCSVTPPLRDPGLTQLPPNACLALLKARVDIWHAYGQSALPAVADSRQTGHRLVGQMQSQLSSRRLIPLDPTDRLHEHLALYEQVTSEILRQRTDPLFAHRNGRLSASIGPGLASASPCVAGVVLIGAGLPTELRQASQLSLGLIRMSSGKLLWLDQVFLPARPTDEDLARALARLLRNFPV